MLLLLAFRCRGIASFFKGIVCFFKSMSFIYVKRLVSRWYFWCWHVVLELLASGFSFLALFFCAYAAYFVHGAFATLQPFACFSNLPSQKSMFASLGCIFCDTSIKVFLSCLFRHFISMRMLRTWCMLSSIRCRRLRYFLK